VHDHEQFTAWRRQCYPVLAGCVCSVKLKPGLTEAELDACLRDQIVLAPVNELLKYQLIETDEDNYRCAPAYALLTASESSCMQAGILLQVDAAAGLSLKSTCLQCRAQRLRAAWCACCCALCCCMQPGSHPRGEAHGCSLPEAQDHGGHHPAG
jgi:hypothetical protein